MPIHPKTIHLLYTVQAQRYDVNSSTTLGKLQLPIFIYLFLFFFGGGLQALVRPDVQYF